MTGVQPNLPLFSHLVAERLPYSNPTTSFDAAQSMKAHAPSIREKVYWYIANSKTGGTADEIEVVTGWRLHTVTARVHELAKAGRIEDVGERRKTRSGRNAIVWYARDDGNGDKFEDA